MRSRVREMVKEEGIFQGEIGRGQSPGIEGKIGTIPGWKIGGDRNWGNGGWKKRTPQMKRRMHSMQILAKFFF